MTDPASLFPGIPAIESPVFGAELERMALTPAEHDLAIALNRDGYAVFDFPDADVDGRIARIRADLAPQLGIDDADPESNKLAGVGRIQDAWKSNSDVRAIAANRDVVDLLSRLYGRPAFPFQTLNFPLARSSNYTPMPCIFHRFRSVSCAACGWRWRISRPMPVRCAMCRFA